MAEAGFPGTGAYTSILNVDSFGGWSLQVRKNSGSGYWTNGAQGWAVAINGGSWSGTWTYDFRGTSLITIASSGSHGNYPRPALGANVGASWWVDMAHGFGRSAGSFTFWSAGTATTPGAPNPVGLDQITPTSMRYRFSGTTTGGSPIIRWEYQYSTTSNFSSGNSAWLTGDGTEEVTGLTPNTTYYFRSRGVNAVGNGALSSVISASTLPAVAPGMTLTPSLSGTSMTVSLTPPGGASGVSKYVVERRIGTGTATAVESVTNSVVVNGLTPGQVYQWRASAFFGTYQTPWTDWTPVAQPNPNTSPGDYFDGATVPPEDSDVTFGWTGTPFNSTSTATGVGVDGWAVASDTGLARLQRVTGGRSGDFAARMVILQDGVGFRVGMNGSNLDDRAAVEVGGKYVGSAFVKPSRPQRLAARARLFNAAGAQTGTVTGDPLDVTDTGGWTRLTVDSGLIPSGVETMVTEVVEAAGGIFSAWQSGEWLDVDDAMVTLSREFDYFDGDTPDTADYDFAWLETPNASASSRTQLENSGFDPLLDPDCPPLPTPPGPPAISDPCIIEVGTWRRYWVQIPAAVVSRWVDVVPTFRITTGSDAERQVRIRVYPNPDELPAASFEGDGGWESEQVLSYIPANATILLDGVSERARASVNGGDWIAADKLLFGTNGEPATWPVLDCGIGYMVAFDAPTDSDVGNLTLQASLTRRF